MTDRERNAAAIAAVNKIADVLGGDAVVKAANREGLTLGKAVEAAAYRAADELRKSEPRLSREVAFAKVWRSPAGTAYRELHRTIWRDEPLEKALRGMLSDEYREWTVELAKHIPSEGMKRLHKLAAELVRANPEMSMSQATVAIRKQWPEVWNAAYEEN